MGLVEFPRPLTITKEENVCHFFGLHFPLLPYKTERLLSFQSYSRFSCTNLRTAFVPFPGTEVMAIP